MRRFDEKKKKWRIGSGVRGIIFLAQKKIVLEVAYVNYL